MSKSIGWHGRSYFCANVVISTVEFDDGSPRTLQTRSRTLWGHPRQHRRPPLIENQRVLPVCPRSRKRRIVSKIAAAFGCDLANFDDSIGNDFYIFQQVRGILHLALNQRVQGSSPCAPTNLFNGLGEVPKEVLPRNLDMGYTWATAGGICTAAINLAVQAVTCLAKPYSLRPLP